VGYRCKTCIKEQQSSFYTGLPVDYIIAAVVSLPLAAVGAFITAALGFFLFAIFIGPAAGALVADLTWRAVGRRRSRYLWLVVSASIVIAAVAVAVFWVGYLIHIGLIIYTVLAVSAAYGRLRLA
jgi:phosphatidylserine synthase